MSSVPSLTLRIFIQQGTENPRRLCFSNTHTSMHSMCNHKQVVMNLQNFRNWGNKEDGIVNSYEDGPVQPGTVTDAYLPLPFTHLQAAYSTNIYCLEEGPQVVAQKRDQHHALRLQKQWHAATVAGLTKVWQESQKDTQDWSNCLMLLKLTCPDA